MAEPGGERTYSGKVTAIIVVAVVVVFVLLNVVAGRNVPRPDQPVTPPSGSVAPAS